MKHVQVPSCDTQYLPIPCAQSKAKPFVKEMATERENVNFFRVRGLSCLSDTWMYLLRYSYFILLLLLLWFNPKCLCVALWKLESAVASTQAK